MKHTFITGLPDYDDGLEVTGEYSAGSPAVAYLSNGDPGYPEEPEEFEIHKVILNGIDIIDNLSDEELYQLEQSGIDYANENDHGDCDDYSDDEYDPYQGEGKVD